MHGIIEGLRELCREGIYQERGSNKDGYYLLRKRKRTTFALLKCIIDGGTAAKDMMNVEAGFYDLFWKDMLNSFTGMY